MSDGYGRIDEIAEDVRLVFRNCLQFHGRGSPLSITALKLSAKFEDLLRVAMESDVFNVVTEDMIIAEFRAKDPEMEVSSKMAIKITERIELFDLARQCMEMPREDLLAAIEKSSSRWMPKWWKPVKHDLAIIETSLIAGFAVQPEGFLEESIANDNEALAYIKDFFNDRGNFIRRFRYICHFVIHGTEPNSKHARMRKDQGLPMIPLSAMKKVRRRRRKTK